MRKFARKLSFVFGFVGIFSLVGSGLAYADNSVGTEDTVIAQGTTITSHGKVHAKIVPMSQVKKKSSNNTVTPMSGSAFDGVVSMDISGDGWYMSHWSIAGQPLPPGECTFSAYWFPGDTVSFFGPDLCNYSNEDAMYFSDASDVYVNGNDWACSTIVGMAGKPCVWVWR